MLLMCGICWGTTGAEEARGQLWGPLPTDYWVAILVVAGFLLMVAEIQIVSYGIMGLAGSACLIAAIFILVRYEQDFFGIPPMYLVPVIVAMMLIFGLLGFLGARTKDQAVAAGAESFVGQQAKVVQDLSPAGKVLFQGTYWDAISSRPVTAGAMVKITASDSMRLTVEPVE
jgi:membrane-bound serine protease (ClpP class)